MGKKKRWGGERRLTCGPEDDHESPQARLARPGKRKGRGVRITVSSIFLRKGNSKAGLSFSRSAKRGPLSSLEGGETPRESRLLGAKEKKKNLRNVSGKWEEGRGKEKKGKALPSACLLEARVVARRGPPNGPGQWCHGGSGGSAQVRLSHNLGVRGILNRKGNSAELFS